ALLMVSRIPTLSMKTVRVKPQTIVPMLIVIVIVAALVIAYPFAALSVAMILYLAHVPYSAYRYRWLAAHPEAWEVPPRQRRAIRGAARRRGLRRPLHHGVAGAAARASARVRRRHNRNNGQGAGRLVGRWRVPDGASRRSRRLSLHPDEHP